MRSWYLIVFRNLCKYQQLTLARTDLGGGLSGGPPSHKRKKPLKLKGLFFLLAETQGFEPWIQVLPGCTLSRGVPSTTRPRLRLKSADDIASALFGQTLLIKTEGSVEDSDGQFQILFVEND